MATPRELVQSVLSVMEFIPVAGKERCPASKDAKHKVRVWGRATSDNRLLAMTCRNCRVIVARIRMPEYPRFYVTSLGVRPAGTRVWRIHDVRNYHRVVAQLAGREGERLIRAACEEMNERWEQDEFDA